MIDFKNPPPIPDLPRFKWIMPKKEFDEKVANQFFLTHPTNPSIVLRFRSTPSYSEPREQTPLFVLKAVPYDCYALDDDPDTIVLIKHYSEETFMTTPLKVIEIELNNSLLDTRENRKALKRSMQRAAEDIERYKQEIKESNAKEKLLLQAIEVVWANETKPSK